MNKAVTERAITIMRSLPQEKLDFVMRILMKLEKEDDLPSLEFLKKMERADKAVAEGRLVTFTLDDFERRYSD